jgi:hypothetical protein
MALTAQTKRSGKLKRAAREYPDPPAFPKDLSRTGIADFVAAHTAWWDKMKTNLSEMEDELAEVRDIEILE